MLSHKKQAKRQFERKIKNGYLQMLGGGPAKKLNLVLQKTKC
jgi:hypothetical protein